MGLFSFVGDAIQDIFGGSKSRSESNQYSQEQMRLSQQFNLDNMAIQQGYTQENMALQNQYNIDAFNRENAYNTPLAQKQRAYQAGINPNWTDGSGVVAQQDSGVSPVGPGSSTPGPVGTTSSPVDPSALIGSITSLSRYVTDIKKTKAETKLLENQAQREAVETEARSIAAGLLKTYGAADAEAEIQRKITEAGKNNASKNEIEKLLYAKEILLGHQSYKEFQQGNINEAFANIAWNDYYNYDERFNNEQGLIKGQTNYYNQSAGLAGTQAQYYPRVVHAQETQALASKKSADAQMLQSRVNEKIGNAMVSLYKMETKKVGAEVGKISAETYAKWLDNHRNEVENTILDTLVEQGVPIAERKAQLKLWETDTELKRLQGEFEKAHTDNERRQIYFNIADRIIELCPKLNLNLTGFIP